MRQARPAARSLPQVTTTGAPSDHQVVAAIWRSIEGLLSSPAPHASSCISHLRTVLQQLDSVGTEALPGIAQLHLSSAGHLMATVKLVAPEAFRDGTAEPNLEALCSVSGPAATAVTAAIELQLFHLTRAKQVTTEMRRRIALKRAAAVQQQQQPQPQSLLVTRSTCSSSLSDDSMVETLE